MTLKHDTRVKKDIKAKFYLRYEDTSGWINYSIKSGSRKGPIGLIFWSLPLIFLEGKVIAAFFKDDEALPIRDTIRTIIPKQKNAKEISIFSYDNFLNALEKECPDYNNINPFTLTRKKTKKNYFDALDYFGFPCINDTSQPGKEYKCRHFTVHAFNGKIAIWIATEKDGSIFFNNKFHRDALNNLAKRVEEISFEEYKIVHGNDSLKTDFYNHVLEKEKVIEQPHYTNGGGKLEVKDYYELIFDALHHALLEDMGWKEDPNNIYIMLSDNVYGCSMRFWLSEDQKNNYKKRFKEQSFEEQNLFLEQVKVYLRKKRGIDINNVIDKILTNLTDNHKKKSLKEMYEQSGTVSSLAKLRGMYDTFLYPNFTSYPIIYKENFIKKRMKSKHNYSETLKYLEEYILLKWPKRDSNMSLAMIPFFLRGISVGCIAFFIPSNVIAEHTTEEQYWYQRIARALRRIESVEKNLEEAAVKQVCRTIFDELEGEAE